MVASVVVLGVSVAKPVVETRGTTVLEIVVGIVVDTFVVVTDGSGLVIAKTKMIAVTCFKAHRLQQRSIIKIQGHSSLIYFG